MYLVGLPEWENMTSWHFRQETDSSIALQELAGLKRGNKQSHKELADSARRLASRAYYSNDYESQEKGESTHFRRWSAKSSS